MDIDILDRVNNIRASVPISSVYPVKDIGSSTCPVCGYNGKFYVKSNWAKCFRRNCDLTIHNQGKHYDVIALYRYKNSLNDKKGFFTALEQLEGSFSLSFDKEESTERTQFFSRVNEIYVSELNSRRGREALQYLIKRGFSSYLIKMLGIGYATHDSILREYGIEESLLDKYNLLSYGKESFSNRITFPVKDLSGRIVHLTARHLGAIPLDDNGRELFGKWKHSKTYLNKSISDYLGLEDLIPSYSKEYVVLTEGYMDALSLYERGIQSLCTFGLNGISKHIQKLSKFETVISVYDVDRYSADDPVYPNEYKSWRLVLPQLSDCQILCNSNTIFRVFFIKPEGVDEHGNIYLCKDVNEWLTQDSLSRRDLLDKFLSSPSILDHQIESNGRDLKHHDLLIKMIVSTNSDPSKLEAYIPEGISPLDYAISIGNF